ncbi:MAG: 30S ribosomal protein S6, partial [Clostridiales bacterium]|nr:30S ribosomal protein S6 [Clostridiales bacterium]
DQKEVNRIMANKYRLVTVLNPELDQEKRESLLESIKTKIASAGTVDALDDNGVQKLAYEIDGQTSGNYVQIYFTAESEFPRELERVLKITDGVLRFLVVRVEE